MLTLSKVKSLTHKHGGAVTMINPSPLGSLSPLWLFVLFLRGSALLILKRLDSIMKLDQKSKVKSLSAVAQLTFDF